MKRFEAEIVGWPKPDEGPYTTKKVYQARSDYEFLGLVKRDLYRCGFKCKLVRWRELKCDISESTQA